MIGQDTYPYYCQVWYDWTRGSQVTVFVQKDDAGLYAVRNDEVLPKGAVGPVVVYSWDGSRWIPACCQANGGVVPMPAPNFVEMGSGRCRALIQNNPYFGNISIWTVALGDNQGQWASDFWYWFNDRQQGVVFSLAPAGSLTIIDYQTFVQNGSIEACVFDDPCSAVPSCSGSQMMRARKTLKFTHMKGKTDVQIDTTNTFGFNCNHHGDAPTRERDIFGREHNSTATIREMNSTYP
jgi:hypothetical protein